MSSILWNRTGGASLPLVLEENINEGRTVIIAGQNRYDGLHALLKAFPELADESHRETYCELCMQLHGGRRYQRIEEPDAFRASYRALLEHGETMHGMLPTVADFGPFDVTEIDAPRISEKTLIFYVKDIRFGIPYRVEAPWPAEADTAVRFLLLPLGE